MPLSPEQQMANYRKAEQLRLEEKLKKESGVPDEMAKMHDDMLGPVIPGRLDDKEFVAATVKTFDQARAQPILELTPDMSQKAAEAEKPLELTRSKEKIEEELAESRKEYALLYAKQKKDRGHFERVRKALGMDSHQPTGFEREALRESEEKYRGAVAEMSRFTHDAAAGDAFAKKMAAVAFLKQNFSAFEADTNPSRDPNLLQKAWKGYSELPKSAKLGISLLTMTGITLATAGVGALASKGSRFAISRTLAAYGISGGALGTIVTAQLGRRAENRADKNINEKTENFKSFDPSNFAIFQKEIEAELKRLQSSKKWARGLGITTAVATGVAGGLEISQALSHLSEVASHVENIIPVTVPEPAVFDQPENAAGQPVLETAPHTPSTTAGSNMTMEQEGTYRAAEYGPVSAHPHLLGEHTFKQGDNLTKVLSQELKQQEAFAHLSPPQQENVVANIIHTLKPEDLKSIGIESGNATLIHPGETLHLGALDATLTNHDHSIESLVAHAKGLPGRVEHAAPHTAHHSPMPIEKPGVPFAATPQLEAVPTQDFGVLSPEDEIIYNGHLLTIHEAANAMMARNLHDVLGEGFATAERMALVGHGLVHQVYGIEDADDLQRFGLYNEHDLLALKEQLKQVADAAKAADPEFVAAMPSRPETIHDFFIRANTIILEHTAVPAYEAGAH